MLLFRLADPCVAPNSTFFFYFNQSPTLLGLKSNYLVYKTPKSFFIDKKKIIHIENAPFSTCRPQNLTFFFYFNQTLLGLALFVAAAAPGRAHVVDPRLLLPLVVQARLVRRADHRPALRPDLLLPQHPRPVAHVLPVHVLHPLLVPHLLLVPLAPHLFVGFKSFFIITFFFPNLYFNVNIITICFLMSPNL